MELIIHDNVPIKKKENYCAYKAEIGIHLTISMYLSQLVNIGLI